MSLARLNSRHRAERAVFSSSVSRGKKKSVSIFFPASRGTHFLAHSPLYPYSRPTKLNLSDPSSFTLTGL